MVERAPAQSDELRVEGGGPLVDDLPSDAAVDLARPSAGRALDSEVSTEAVAEMDTAMRQALPEEADGARSPLRLVRRPAETACRWRPRRPAEAIRPV